MIRITITDDEIGGLRITIPVRRNWFMIFFFSLWLCFWAAAEVIVPADAIAGRPFGQGKMVPGSMLLFLLAWFTLWTLGGLMVLYALLWNLAGREVISLTDGALVVRRELGVLQRARAFDLAGVRNLRYSPVVHNPFSFSGSWGWQLQLMGLSGGSIAFDHGGKTHRFGNSLTEIEAARLIATIQQHYKIPDNREVEPLPISD
jgi:hypothetical protein